MSADVVLPKPASAAVSQQMHGAASSAVVVPNTQASSGLNISPVLKRFLKGLVATLIASALTYGISFLNSNPTVLGTSTALITAILLAVEKSFPANL